MKADIEELANVGWANEYKAISENRKGYRKDIESI